MPLPGSTGMSIKHKPCQKKAVYNRAGQPRVHQPHLTMMFPTGRILAREASKTLHNSWTQWLGATAKLPPQVASTQGEEGHDVLGHLQASLESVFALPHSVFGGQDWLISDDPAKVAIFRVLQYRRTRLCPPHIHPSHILSPHRLPNSMHNWSTHNTCGSSTTLVLLQVAQHH